MLAELRQSSLVRCKVAANEKCPVVYAARNKACSCARLLGLFRKLLFRKLFLQIFFFAERLRLWLLATEFVACTRFGIQTIPERITYAVVTDSVRIPVASPNLIENIALILSAFFASVVHVRVQSAGTRNSMYAASFVAVAYHSFGVKGLQWSPR